MTTITIGSKAPLDLLGKSKPKNKNLVLYFYPRDDTPGCTTEGKDFAALSDAFAEQNTVIIGVSRDNDESHEKFKCKYNLPFELIADEDGTLCKAFDVTRMKNMFGKSVLGTVRSTFLIDKKGVLREEWRKVKVEGHAKAVLKAASDLE